MVKFIGESRFRDILGWLKSWVQDKFLAKSDYLSGMTWDYIENHFTWDDLDGTSTSGDDTYTTNLGLTKPGRLSTVVVNGNADILDAAVGDLQDSVSRTTANLTLVLSGAAINYSKLIKQGGFVFCFARISGIPETAGQQLLASVPVGFRPDSDYYFPVGTTAILPKSGTEGEIFGYVQQNGNLSIAGVGRQIFVNAVWPVSN